MAQTTKKASTSFEKAGRLEDLITKNEKGVSLQREKK